LRASARVEKGFPFREKAVPDRPHLHDPLHYLCFAAPGDCVLTRDDHHAIARREQLFKFNPHTLELPEDALVVLEHRLTTTVDTRLRSARVSVELNLGMEKWRNLGIAPAAGVDPIG
jgi:hypothetical protein